MLLSLLITTTSYAQKQLLGKWLTESKDGIVEFYKENNKYYGKIVKLIPATHDDGSPIKDLYNPDKNKQQRLVLGINSITAFEWDEENQTFINGQVYDPKNGKFYRGKIWIEAGTLKLRGYVGIFYRTETWTRVR